MVTLDFFISGLMGLILVSFADTFWYYKSFQRAEKGIEFLEHYHWGIIIITVSFVCWYYSSIIPDLLNLFAGLFTGGMLFIYKELYQDQPFAKWTDHFAQSTAVGLGVCAIAVTVFVFTR
jgi:hypothetical protein